MYTGLIVGLSTTIGIVLYSSPYQSCARVKFHVNHECLTGLFPDRWSPNIITQWFYTVPIAYLSLYIWGHSGLYMPNIRHFSTYGWALIKNVYHPITPFRSILPYRLHILLYRPIKVTVYGAHHFIWGNCFLLLHVLLACNYDKEHSIAKYDVPIITSRCKISFLSEGLM